MAMSRRSFVSHSLGVLAAAAAQGLLRPQFVMAQGMPASGPVKNFVHIFLRGGMDTLAAMPFTDGPMEAFLRGVRPNIYPSAGSIITPSGFNQSGRQNLIGLHPEWADMVNKAQQVGAGISLITRYGVTLNNSFSHDIATAHMHNGTNRDGASVTRGWLAGLIDGGHLPAMAAWGINAVNDPRFFNAQTERPMVLDTNLDTYTFQTRGFGSVDCRASGGKPALPGCPTGGDRQTSGSDDFMHARSISRRLVGARSGVAGSLEEAISGSLQGMYDSVGIITSDVKPLPIADSMFRPSSGTQNSWQSSVRDLTKALVYANSTAAPASLRNSSKIFCTSFGGWDTHREQASILSSNVRVVSGAIKGLLHYLDQYNMLDQTVIMVTSEFARTTRQNGSRGTDHADASTCLVVGGRVHHGVLGPELTVEEGLARNSFDAEVAFTGVLRQILGTQMGFSTAALDAAFPDRLPNEVTLPLFT